MSFSDICNDVATRLGRLAGKGHNVLSSAREKVKDSANLPEKIQNAMFEKLSRTLYKQAQFMMGKISERMEVIDEVARPFYEKVNALNERGPVSESQLWSAMNSIEAAQNLSEEEKTLLINIFGQFVGAQKSKVVDAVVVEGGSSTKRKSKSQLNGAANG